MNGSSSQDYHYLKRQTQKDSQDLKQLKPSVNSITQWRGGWFFLSRNVKISTCIVKKFDLVIKQSS